MERKKHKRLTTDTILKPEDLKKARIQKTAGSASASSSSSSSGVFKAKLDFRSAAPPAPKPNQHINSTAGPSIQSSHVVRPVFDEKWKEFGDTINLNLETFAKSIKESIELDKFNKVARMLVAALKSFLADDKLKVEYRLLGTIAETIKNHGHKLNHVPLHRGLLFIICNSRTFPDDILQLFVAMATSLAKQQPMRDKCYIEAFLHDAIGMNTGLGTTNRCSWIEKPFSQELVRMIMGPFATIFPDAEMYTACQLENFSLAEYFPKERMAQSEDADQLAVFLEFLKPWFDNIRGEVLPKPLFRALCLLCGHDHVRFFIASRLDVWITLQKFHREISDLLLVLGCNIDASRDLDKDVIDILLKLNTKNMKTRTVSGPFLVAIRRSCQRPGNVHAVFESLILNETGVPQNRSPANLPTMFMLLTSHPVEATKALAQVCAQELIREKETSAKMLRSFLRELIRGFNHTRSGDFPFSVFAATFLDCIVQRGVADEVANLAVELIAQIPLATISSLLITRENAFASKYNVLTDGESPLVPVEARITRATFQSEFVLYCEKVLSGLSKARMVFFDDNTYSRSYTILLYLEKQRDVYTSIEASAVSDGEIGNCIRIFGECGVSENVFSLLLANNQLSSKVIVDLASALTQRAASYHLVTDTPLITLSDPFKLIDRFLQLTIFSENEIPRIKDLPQLCSRNLYWTAWNTIILWLAGGEIGPSFSKVFESYPILRYLVYCIMTRKYEFPLDFEGKSAETMQEEETKISLEEGKVLNSYEKKMMRKLNSLQATAFLLPDKKDIRAPLLLDDLRLFAEKFKLVSRFSRCLSPPLLYNLVANIGAESSLYAIREMLAADSSAAKMLSSECIFHALMYYFDAQRIREADKTSKKIIKALVRQAELNFKSTEPIDDDFLLQSFITSLASRNSSIRSAVVNTFAKLFPSSEGKTFDLSKLSKAPRFEASKLKYLDAITGAILVESDDSIANLYLQFLTHNIPDGDVKHELAESLCRIVSMDSDCIQSSLCEYFVQYVNQCFENHSVKQGTSLDDQLICVQIGTCNVAISREVTLAIVKLLSNYSVMNETTAPYSSYESLMEIWLSPGSIPKIVNLQTGAEQSFLNLQMKMAMLQSPEQRIVDAALDEMSSIDAQAFVILSQMSPETATKVIKQAEHMNLEGIERKTLANMYLVIRGYEANGVECATFLANRLKSQLEGIDSLVSKEELMDVPEMYDPDIKMPEIFFEPNDGTEIFANLDNNKMTTQEISTWLKNNCSVAQAAKQKEKEQKEQKEQKEPKEPKEPPIFKLTPSFIQSAMDEEKSALACLQHIEANLKYFLSHEPAFQTLIVLVDSASNKFDFVRKRLENLAVRLQKSVSPPASVDLVLQKHVSNSKPVLPIKKALPAKATTFAEFAMLVKGLSFDREKYLVDNFIKTFITDKGEVIETADVLVFVRSIRSVYIGGNAEITAEKCFTNRWTRHLQQVVCAALLEKYRENVCSIFMFRLLSAHCRRYPMASYHELFTMRVSPNSNKFVVNKAAYKSLSVYFSDLISKHEEYEGRIVDLVVDLEKEGRTDVGFQLGRALIQTSCGNPRTVIRKSAQLLLDLIADRLSYLSYRNGFASSLRVLTNVESRDSCIRRCEQIIDRLVEVPFDPNMALVEDICEEDKNIKETKDEEPRYASGSKRQMDRNRGGPPIKKGKFITPKDLPIPLIGGPIIASVEESPAEEPVKREWLATTSAMTRFVAMLREHPNVVKIKFPVLANFVSRLTAMSKKELKDEHRLRKVDLILQAVIVLCPCMRNDEMLSVETALVNCLEFYEKHIDDASFGLKEQTSCANLFIRACAAYLNHNYADARTFFQDIRPQIERVCSRCCGSEFAQMVLINTMPLPP